MLHVKMQKEIKRVWTVGYKWRRKKKTYIKVFFLEIFLVNSQDPYTGVQKNFFQKNIECHFFWFLALCGFLRWCNSIGSIPHIGLNKIKLRQIELVLRKINYLSVQPFWLLSSKIFICLKKTLYIFTFFAMEKSHRRSKKNIRIFI